MRIIAFILLVCCLQVAANTSAQEKITLKEKGASLLKIFTEIQKQTGYSFFITEETIKEAKPIDIEVRNASLKDVLDICFRNQPLSYSINRTTITITPKKKASDMAGEVNARRLIDITGKVTDNEGAPLSGATITIKDNQRTTITNAKGEFSLKSIDNNAVLVVTSVGHETEEVNIKGRTSIDVMLKVKIVRMEEVQIIGYGMIKKKFNTGNVATVKAADIEKQPVQNPLLALQGRVPGVFVLQTSGLAGSSVKIQIQGQNSIANGNNPLYVIDGVPIISELPITTIDGVLGSKGPNYSGNGNPLNYIDISDIERIEILKDADATSIYGSRAANGAILITTKKGKEGPMKLDLNMQTGWGKVTRGLNVLNTRQYLDMRYEAFRNDGINWKDSWVSADDLKVWDTTRYTDWQKTLLGNTARYANYNATVSGGTPTVQYLLGGTYHKETTVFPLSKDFADTKISVNSNLTATSLDQKFKMQFSGSYLFDKNQLPRFDMTQAALFMEPNAPSLYNADGTLNWMPDASGTSTFSTNPMIFALIKYSNKTANLISNLVLAYKLLPELEIKTNMGYNNLQTDDFSGFPLIAAPPERRNIPGTQRSADFGHRAVNSWIIEPQANYKTHVSKGKLDVLLGATLLNLKTNVNALRSVGQLSDELLENINAAATVSSIYTLKSEYKYNAVFGRLNYNWLDKYIVNLTARRDGSSRFGSANKFHNFGSVGAAWLFSNEAFFDKESVFLSFGKLKGSYGTTGNDQIGDYTYLSLYNYLSVQVPYQGNVSIMPAGLPNPHLQWEGTKKLQVGIELAFWQERIFLSATYARNRSDNQLLSYPVSSVAGFTNYPQNFPAAIQNRNWEFQINTKNISDKHFNWTSSFNLTLPKNKLLSFPDLAVSSYARSLEIGQPLSIQKLLHFAGVDPTTGMYLFQSKTDPFNPQYPDDYTVLKKIDPVCYGGLQNTFSYKQFELDFLFQFVKQTGYNDATFWNGNRTPGSFFPSVSNQPVSVLGRWQKPGDNSMISKFSSANNFLSPIVSSDYRFTDASFIRLKNVAVSWEAPKSWIKKMSLKKCRMYINAQNVITITKYKGIDPESKSILTPALPPLRVIMAGLQLSF